MPTLQEQINIASSGAVIQHDTEFVGNLIINKPITIQGTGKIRTPNADPAIDIVPKTGPVTLRGLEISTTPGWALTYMIVRMGMWQTSDIAEVPQGLTIEACNIHGQPGQDIQQGVAANGANVIIRNSKIWEIHHRGADCQAIAAWNGPGPFIIEDNYLEASGENIMFGGAEARIQGLVPSNIQVRRNHMLKPLSWCLYDQASFKSPFGQVVTWTTSPMPGLDEDPGERFPPRYVDARGNRPTRYKVKNIFELKNARNVVVEGNILENCWVDAQTGYGVLFTVRGEDGKNPWATIENVVFRHNTIKNVPAGFQLIGKDAGPSLQGTGLIISNNLIQFGTGLGSNGRLVQMQQFNNVAFENNEADPPHTDLVLSGQDSSGAPLLSRGLIYRNNLLKFGQYGVFCDGDKPFTAYAPDGLITGNYIYGPSIPAARKIANNSYFDAKPGVLPVGVGVNYEALKAAQSGTSVTAPAPTPAPAPAPSPSPTSAPIPTTSPNGTKAKTITDSLGRVWTLGSRGETLRDGVHIANGFGLIYKWQDQVVYVFADDNNWWKFNGEGWQGAGPIEPGTAAPAPTPQPSPSPIPLSTRSVAWPKQWSKQNPIIDAQWRERFRLKRVDEATAKAEFEKVI